MRQAQVVGDGEAGRQIAAVPIFISTDALAGRMVTVEEAYHRVDAARRLMAVPGRRAEASGRLFFAKRVHEALKRGGVDLDAVLTEVEGSLSSDAARHGARREHQEMQGRIEEAEGQGRR